MNLRAAVPLAVLCVASCHGGHDHTRTVQIPAARPVSILVEVYDPATNFVWENVSVRVVEADQEWSQSTHASPFVDDWFLTDNTGQVFFDEFTLAAAEVGFFEDGAGRALLSGDRREDTATVVLEIDAIGLGSQIVEVPLSWDVPDVFVSVPFP